jgi:hypothetical protein
VKSATSKAGIDPPVIDSTKTIDLRQEEETLSGFNERAGVEAHKRPSFELFASFF